MQKECLECGESILGRTDKKFCSDLCRNSHNNKRNSTNGTYIRKVNILLKRNRQILKELVPVRQAKISKLQLLERGFNFHFYTNVERSAKGDEFFFCYEYGYLPLKKGNVLLIKRQNKAA